jgi:ubiquitin carboxyl-terminal hydrolase 10
MWIIQSLRLVVRKLPLTSHHITPQREHIHTVEDALAYISHPQPVSVSGASAGRMVEASQQVLIESLPPVLVLHVKRFLYDAASGGVVKVGRRVGFGPELEFGAGAFIPVDFDRKRDN